MRVYFAVCCGILMGTDELGLIDNSLKLSNTLRYGSMFWRIMWLLEHTSLIKTFISLWEHLKTIMRNIPKNYIGISNLNPFFR